VDKTRNEVLRARVNLYMAAKKWDMAAAVASPSQSFALPSRGSRTFPQRSLSPTSQVEAVERRPLRRQPEDHNFGSLIMLAVTAGAFLLVTWVATKALFFFLQEAPIP
jgi:hypothetical protein